MSKLRTELRLMGSRPGPIRKQEIAILLLQNSEASEVAQAKAEALREASEDLDPDLGVVDYYEEPQVNRIVSKCRDWLDARAATIEGESE